MAGAGAAGSVGGARVSVRALLMCPYALATVAAGPSGSTAAAPAFIRHAIAPHTSWPWEYNWDRFPAAWFGANGTVWESKEQIEAIGKYSLAILGWQHLVEAASWTAVVYAQLTQAAVIKDAHPTLPVFVYAGFGFAFGLNAATWRLMNRPEYSDFFMQSTDGPEFTHTNCEQMGVRVSPHCTGYFWNFANASARDYFVEQLVAPLAMAPMIDGVFFDAVNYAYDIPSVRPFGRPVVNIPNCSAAGGCELLLSGTLDVMARTTRLLNAHNKVPMFANLGSFENNPSTKIWMDEHRVIDALSGLSWSSYYETLRAEKAVSSGVLPNMLAEGRAGVRSASHTYYHQIDEDPTPHMAAFLLAREEHWYYLGSTGWLDKDYAWTPLYDRKCGKPLAAAKVEPPLYSREYESCAVLLNCSRGDDACEGSIRWQPKDARGLYGVRV